MTRSNPIAPDPTDQPESYTYLLRLQRSGPNGAWRIRLESVGIETHRAFSSLDELKRYLQLQMGEDLGSFFSDDGVQAFRKDASEQS